MKLHLCKLSLESKHKKYDFSKHIQQSPLGNELSVTFLGLTVSVFKWKIKGFPFICGSGNPDILIQHTRIDKVRYVPNF